jgi:galactokinase
MTMRGVPRAWGSAVDNPTGRRAIEVFADRCGGLPAWLVRAPGRVNLLGEHTDYNDGFVLPVAIDRATWVALRPRTDGRVRAWSEARREWADFATLSVSRNGQGWAEYVKGAAWALDRAGYRVRGWEGVITSDVPIGAGLSSSAALELATLRAFASVSGSVPWDTKEMAGLARRAENEWVGVACGIMDQLVVAEGRDGHALLIDCRSLASTPIPLPAGTVLVVLDTGTRRDLATSAYNERRAQCRSAATAFGVPALRDLDPPDLLTPPLGLEPLAIKRARHVVTENQRVREAAEAMRTCNLSRLGLLMRQSHHSLRDDFEVSNRALDAMADCSNDAGCWGARMTGAGFGGCVVAIVDAADCAQFVSTVSKAYRAETGLVPAAFVCRGTAGASATALSRSS